MRELEIGKMNQQRGAVLIVALIMLLLLTLVGVAGMRDTQLQEKMAGGTEDRALAFQAAESALREGESLVVTGSCTGSCATYGYYDPAIGKPLPVRKNSSNAVVSEADFWAHWFGGTDSAGNAVDWGDTTKVKVYVGGSTPTPLPVVNSQPRYVIELLPAGYSTLPKSTNSGASGQGSFPIRDYLITARGTGRTDNAVVILQSLYRYAGPATP